MDVNSIMQVVQTASISIVMTWLWWTERADRREAERRERDTLRDVAGMKREE